MQKIKLRTSYPQWFIDELAHDEDKAKAINKEFTSKDRVDFVCSVHGVYNQRISEHIKNGERYHGCPKCAWKVKDLAGQKFGDLFVEYENGNNLQGKKLWHCRCSCGNECDVITHDLISGKQLNCRDRKNHKPKNVNFIDLTGQQFGRLTVIEQAPSNESSEAMWLCECNCENKTRKIIRGKDLRNGKIKSCGCYKGGKRGFRKLLKDKKFGYLRVIEDFRGEDGQHWCKCKCEADGCNNFRDVLAKNLSRGAITSCGCMSHYNRSLSRLQDLRGMRFGNLTVNSLVGVGEHGAIWKCTCVCGNETEVVAGNLKTGSVKTCGCHTGIKYYDDIKGQQFGYLIAENYVKSEDGDARWECRCTHCNREDLVVVRATLLKNGSTTSCGCLDIAHGGSKQEIEIREYIKENSNYNIQKDRNVLNGKEIDIYIPELKLGIEYNGSVYHATINSVYEEKPKLYHQQKFLLAKEKGVHLISIFDVDWENNQEKIKMYLNSLILPQKKLFARKCKLDIVDNDIAVDFVNKYHLQGANKATMKINYGLYYDNELMAVMSFGKLRLAKHKEGEFELHRYCVKDGYTILGGAERLLKAFERDYSPKYIVSYSDNDYFLGGIYERLKFENVGQSRPRYYWYLYGKELRREQCMLKHLKVSYPALLQEAIDVKASNKEDYVMSKLGASKVYRSGNTKWEKRY